MSAIAPVASVSAVSSANARPQADRQDPQNLASAAPPTPAPVQKAQPITYYGGIDGMNATNLIVALQANGFVSDGYSARAIESGGTPPPAIVDRGA
ncbi:MAG: hypothetical protein AB7L36_04480 [Sphingomonadaceae bacterium]